MESLINAKKKIILKKRRENNILDISTDGKKILI